MLFGIRYDSHWRRQQFVAQAHAASGINQPSPARINISSQNLQIPNQSSISNLPNVETPVKMIIAHNIPTDLMPESENWPFWIKFIIFVDYHLILSNFAFPFIFRRHDFMFCYQTTIFSLYFQLLTDTTQDVVIEVNFSNFFVQNLF